MVFGLKKLSCVTVSMFLVNSLAYAEPNGPAVGMPDWLLQQELRQEASEPCESYPDCYDIPPFAPEPTEPEEEEL